jgi:hypothetical protein
VDQRRRCLLILLHLKGHGNEPDFPRVLHKSVRHRSLTLHFEPFRFRLRILGDICIRKTTPRLNDTGIRRLSVSTIRGVRDSTIWGVDDSPYHWYAESTTPCITDRGSQLLNFLKETRCIGDTESRRLPISLSRRVVESLIRRVADSQNRWVGESTTPRIGD